jgi:MFS family permease
MDEARQVRFLVAPFYFLASLVAGAMLAGKVTPDNLSDAQLKSVLAAAAAIIAATVPLGFLIGSLSIMALRAIFRLGSALRWAHNSTYEASLSPETWGRIWSRLRMAPERPFAPPLALYTAATYDHEVLPRGIHEWLGRRWNAFNVSVSSATALVLAPIVGALLSIPLKPAWWITSIVLVVLFLATATLAWRDTMKMIEFQSYRAPTHEQAELPRRHLTHGWTWRSLAVRGILILSSAARRSAARR